MKQPQKADLVPSLLQGISWLATGIGQIPNIQFAPLTLLHEAFLDFRFQK